MSLFDKVTKMVLNGKFSELEATCDILVKENTSLRDLEKRIEKRIVDLESALYKMIKMFSNQWAGSEEGAAIRSCRIVLEDTSWRK